MAGTIDIFVKLLPTDTKMPFKVTGQEQVIEIKVKIFKMVKYPVG